jgi:hypothetical protein
VELELLEAALRYDSEVPGLGERFGAEIKRVTDPPLEYPSIGKEVALGGASSPYIDSPSPWIDAASPEVGVCSGYV